ncbi:MAG: FHA domain-containing protein [Oscillospiraceae bacterium]
MAMVQCPQGHYYDDIKCTVCPTCEGRKSFSYDMGDEGKTVALKRQPGDDTVSIQSVISEDINDKTISLYSKTEKVAVGSITGWLICVDGAERGRDFRLVVGRNFVGRSPAMPVSISGDMQISAEKHFSVVFEPKDRNWFIVPGEGTVTYLNGELLTKVESLSDRDTVKVGNTTLSFVCFCREDFVW